VSGGVLGRGEQWAQPQDAVVGHAALAAADGDRRRITAAGGLAGQGRDEIFPDLYRGMDNNFLRPASSVDARPS
jgi:hypothetical protein